MGDIQFTLTGLIPCSYYTRERQKNQSQDVGAICSFRVQNTGCGERAKSRAQSGRAGKRWDMSMILADARVFG